MSSLMFLQIGFLCRSAPFAFSPGIYFGTGESMGWWQAWWALTGYLALAGLATSGLLCWRLRTARRRNDELEGLIAARTRESQVAKLDAESASHAKSAFLANMSHELRTPLNAILGYAQILRKEGGLSEKGRQQLEIVGRNGEHLLQMINEVLDLAKIEAGKMALNAAQFPLTRAVKVSADLFDLRAADKGLAFRLEIGAGLPKVVSGDEPKLRQVLFNLLGNAVKFTTEGEVVLAVTQAYGRVRFEVRDTGPGIPGDQLKAIFEPFHQAAPAAASAQGAGLGLAISQRLAELLGGTIQVQSTLGAGSRFWLELPLREVAAVTGGAAAEGELPDPALLAALEELMFAGDVAGLRERIVAAIGRGERGGTMLRQLDQLAAAFKTAEIRLRLGEARTVATRP